MASLLTEASVIESVIRIFGSHLNLLKLPYLHCIYTVPPWLRFVLPGAVAIEIVPTIHLWNNDPDRTPFPSGWKSMRSLLIKRFEADGFERVFGQLPPADLGQETKADKLIASCGGHFRDLQRLLREMIVRIQTQSRSLPVTPDVIDRSINEVRGQYLPVAVDDAHWLAKIGEQCTALLQSVAPDQVNRLSRFLDTHFVLYFSNGEEWYDIHPLIRDEVARLTSTEPPKR